MFVPPNPSSPTFDTLSQLTRLIPGAPQLRRSSSTLLIRGQSGYQLRISCPDDSLVGILCASHSLLVLLCPVTSRNTPESDASEALSLAISHPSLLFCSISSKSGLVQSQCSALTNGILR